MRWTTGRVRSDEPLTMVGALVSETTGALFTAGALTTVERLLDVLEVGVVVEVTDATAGCVTLFVVVVVTAGVLVCGTVNGTVEGCSCFVIALAGFTGVADAAGRLGAGAT